MFKNLELINNEIHKDMYVKNVNDLSFAKEEISVPITISEFFLACRTYPIVFVKSNDMWIATAILGYEENKNVFVDENGKWRDGAYIPGQFRKYPFNFANVPNRDELLLGVVKDYLTDEEIANRKLFNNKENSEFLNAILTYLNQFNAEAKATSDFIKQLENWELLEEKSLTIVNKNNQQFNLNGFYIINEEKLNHLSKKKESDICSKKVYPLISAHLISLLNINTLSI